MDRNEVEAWLNAYDVENYTINEDLSVDVKSSVFLSSRYLVEIPIKFRNVSGSFFCNDNKLTNLEGCPIKVSIGFYCYDNNLVSLLGGPIDVGVDFGCHNNFLTSLVGGPVRVGGSFICLGNNLSSLEGCPVEIVGDFDCSNNKLTSLEGCPVSVGGIFECDNNKIIDSEVFLYSCVPEQVSQYYKNKHLSEGLKNNLSEKVEVDIKRKKL